ncbi:DUF3180 domain-containing protein [Corynebacterium gerontici]|uniref:DUF3180 domain-containing protein n=1 Tax=Corynebacterium gerontici TaxID=2079234 RepID=A0A3G6J115_9CORY|nr:DUF3180 domain-containing protein [Corynebacterium gerontici]AZA10658.1 hypothetical protein CGERO_01620 [Corynebacterium gerontici]
MKRTNVSSVLLVGVVAAAGMWIITRYFYASMINVPASVPMAEFLIAAVLAWAAIRVSQRVEKHQIGQDRSQLNPVTAAKLLAVGKAGAWTGALFGGAYVGRALYVVPKMGELVAAHDDVPLVLASVAGGLAMSAAGLWLERACSVPPPPNGEAVR